MNNTLQLEEYRDFQWDQVEQYIKGVEDGTIITNKWIKLAVQKFKDDVTNPAIDVSVGAIDRVFEFFSIINSEFDGDIIQFKLLPFQAFIIASIFGPYWKGTDIRKYRVVFI